MSITRLKEILIDLPHFNDEESAQRAYFLNSLVALFYVCWILGLGFAMVIDLEPESKIEIRALLIIILGMIILVRWMIVRRNLKLAGLLFSLIFWLTLAIFSLIGTGLTGITFLMLVTLTPFLVGFAYGRARPGDFKSVCAPFGGGTVCR